MSVTTKVVTASKKKGARPLTIKQQNLVRLLVENVGKRGGMTKKGEIVLAAGYSAAQALNPQQVIEAPRIKDALKEFTDELDEKRRLALKHMTEAKLKKTSAPALSQVIDTLTKNHQLLTGGATANVAHAVRRMKTEDLETLVEELEKSGE